MPEASIHFHKELITAWLHAEHAVLGGLERRIEGGAQAEANDQPRVRRVDNAVVPQSVCFRPQ